MRPKHSILYNALLLTAVNLMLRGISMLFQVYLSTAIGPAGIGLLQLILTAGSFAMTLGLSGARVAAIYLCAEEYGHRRQDGVRSALLHCLRYSLIISLAVGTALFFLSPYIAEVWIKNDCAVDPLRHLALALPLNCACAVLSGYFTACGQIRRLAAIEVAERLLSLVFTMLLLLFWAGGELSRCCSAIVLGGNLACLFSVAALFLYFRRDCRAIPASRKAAPMGRRLLKLCVPLALGEYLRSGLGAIEQFLIPWGLARFGGSREASLAAYGTICGMVFPILMFPAAILFSLSDLLVSELSRCRAEKNSRRICRLTDKCLRMGLIFSVFVAGLMYVLSSQLGRMIYHSEQAGQYLRVFAPMILILYMDAMVDGMHKGLGQQAACVRYNTLTSFLDVAFLYLLLPRFGIGAYVFTFALTHVINFYLSLRRLLLVTSYTPSASFSLRTLACGIVAVLAGVCVSSGPGAFVFFYRSVSYCAVFFLLLSLCGIVRQEDRLCLKTGR